MKGISRNFGHKCVWIHTFGFIDLLSRFWGQKSKGFTAGGAITVDDSPSSSILF